MNFRHLATEKREGRRVGEGGVGGGGVTNIQKVTFETKRTILKKYVGNSLRLSCKAVGGRWQDPRR
jgi:hypothetical protein